jgi:hypothetical protein
MSLENVTWCPLEEIQSLEYEHRISERALETIDPAIRKLKVVYAMFWRHSDEVVFALCTFKKPGFESKKFSLMKIGATADDFADTCMDLIRTCNVDLVITPHRKLGEKLAALDEPRIHRALRYHFIGRGLLSIDELLSEPEQVEMDDPYELYNISDRSIQGESVPAFGFQEAVPEEKKFKRLIDRLRSFLRL